MKVTCMPIVCFIFSPFGLNTYSLRSVLVAYACMLPSEQGFKNDILMAKKWLYFAKKVLLRLNFERKGHLYANCLFYILDICCKSRLFQLLPCGIRMYIAILTGVGKGHISG